ncbi:LAMI_0D10286g1_1 [Lachancea mirantina]|uniref:LAMI_0D10286g1_1 n=1 Tax=Lachancea mirantina TaxID=1230905 RepID=A0A1G4JEE9_9SACH|nr:LAMI_0D10286g1_1 [Lachancea mirantina]
MSIRPSPNDDIPETSFEDIETTLSPINRYKNGYNQSSPLRKQMPPPSTTSSESTTFSGNGNRYSTHTESDDADEEGKNFLDEFEEFHDKDEYQDIIKAHFDGRKRSNEKKTGMGGLNAFAEENGDNIDELADQFDQNLTLRARKSSEIPTLKLDKNAKQPNVSLKKSIRMPKSFERVSRRGIGNSRSASNLRVNWERPAPTNLRYKKSMPLLSREGIINEEYEDNNYEEDFEDDFKFEKNMLQPQFLNREPQLKPISPRQYTITTDETLLTPQLHSRHKDWVNPSNLNHFKEQQRRKARESGSYRKNRESVNHRLKTIKQEIDQNTPIKKGKMIYNPEKRTWEGNEQSLLRFRDVDTAEKKAIVITDKKLPYSSGSRARISDAKRQSNPKIVGKMMFDAQNLQWLRVDGQEEDPFADIPDYIPVTIPLDGGPQRSATAMIPQSSHRDPTKKRFSSTATTRFHSLSTTPYDFTFQIDSRTLEKFYHEENRWSKKVGGWFILDDPDVTSTNNDQKLPDPQSKNFMYEIRNMVISSARN